MDRLWKSEVYLAIIGFILLLIMVAAGVNPLIAILVFIITLLMGAIAPLGVAWFQKDSPTLIVPTLGPLPCTTIDPIPGTVDSDIEPGKSIWAFGGFAAHGFQADDGGGALLDGGYILADRRAFVKLAKNIGYLAVVPDPVSIQHFPKWGMGAVGTRYSPTHSKFYKAMFSVLSLKAPATEQNLDHERVLETKELRITDMEGDVEDHWSRVALYKQRVDEIRGKPSRIGALAHRTRDKAEENENEEES